MFVVELAFTDHPARLDLRPHHRELLAGLHVEGEVVAAGPFPDQSGAVLVFDASRERVDEILAEDPYYSAEGVSVVAIREFDPVVGN